MDIVTHAVMGAILVSPFLQTHPLEACGFVLGTVLPDIDALSRLAGKRAFLRCHQTLTHSLPLILAAGLLGDAALWGTGSPASGLPLAIAAGAVLHVLLDLTNTYGVTLLAPFSWRRRALEWVFFVDGVVVLVTLAALGALALGQSRHGELPGGVAAVYLVTLLAYLALRARLREAAWRRAPPGTLSLIPSALLPWVFLGCARRGDEVRTFRLDVWSSRVTERPSRPVHDRSYQEVLAQVEEYRVMRELSPAYHVVEAAPGPTGTHLVCQDLRTRNFGGRFGRLDVDLDPDGGVAGVWLHV